MQVNVKTKVYILPALTYVGQYERLYFVPYEKICRKTAACKLFRSFVRPSFVRRLLAASFRRRDNFFDDVKIFEKQVWVDAIDFVQKSSKS